MSWSRSSIFYINVEADGITTTSSAVLINGSPDSFFNPSRGLRQGDPLSSYLFLFCMEALSRTLTHAEDLSIITGIKICGSAPSINHLLFADDCMVFCKANKVEAQNLMDILNIFGETSGQLINFNKSGVFFSKNTDPNLFSIINNIMGVQVLQLDDKYLGSPLFTHISKIKSFKPGVDKLKLRLSIWKNVHLDHAGREVLIKTVTSTASIYQMNCFRIPKQTCQDLNKLQRDFFRGKNLENPRGYYPKAWTTICKPKDMGGLGFMNMELFNSFMITKIGWRLEQEKDFLWYKIMDAKYLLGRNVLNMDTKAKPGDSWIWKGILEGIQNIQQHYNWKIALYKANIEHLYKNDTSNRNWEGIWRLDTAPAIKIFLWNCAHEILPTNAKTASILQYINPICQVCSSGEETMTHLFLNCPNATAIWHEILGTNHGKFDNNTNFMDWFNSWFDTGAILGKTILYATTCWHIWKARCDLVFNHITPNVKHTSHCIQQYLCDYSRVHNLSSHALNDLLSNNLGTDTESVTHIPYDLNHTPQEFGFTIRICTIQNPKTCKFFSALTILDAA
ncbi:uncharacterized protein LOC113315758 [Papaver somniferum]|uniref:uncharacterized protein LOC113315758 n=1 Tax=Papaver somniferum TaxID=3469 RepID=UPI000E704D03|nr:uncharacterized protein LOC113315758 [Papaver somniferum]